MGCNHVTMVFCGVMTKDGKPTWDIFVCRECGHLQPLPYVSNTGISTAYARTISMPEI